MQSYLIDLIAKAAQSPPPLNTARITEEAWPLFTAQVYFPLNSIKALFPFSLSFSRRHIPGPCCVCAVGFFPATICLFL